MQRRDFIKNSALATASLASLDAFSEIKKMKKVGVQLFSLPKMLDQNFEESMKMLAKIGFKDIEMYGPYPFSVPTAHASWNAVTPQLGFSGSGYFGNSIDDVKKIFDDNGLSTNSAHTDLDTLKNNMGQLAAAANTLGQKYVVLPAIPEAERKNLDAYKRIAETFNKIGESAIKEGIRFAYHNHGYGLNPIEGQTPLDLILEQTDPNLVFFEMDIYWTSAGGASPIEYLKKYPNRYKLMHLKDMKEAKTFAGDGSNASQWIALFPYMTTAGNGVLNVKKIVETALKSGVQHFYVEQDMVAEPEIALKKSFDFVNKI
jgi:sugar phosphate isomerase/epimerase